ncbi:hypothetical protein RGQ29_013821 [Quercus rubra]|uniref:General transcription and DNA repair factor IIH subunit TFB4 n=1 Tax=Quercus rubra TaxID=3512 RepID=A0AAN7FTV9_QUERU|nr:hypothetical protein RGQ29_013821 [Quercus rubra]
MFTNTSSGHLPLLESWSERLRCFCHKKTIDMGYICSVCLSIFCKHHKKCSTCGLAFGQAQSDIASASNLKRKTPET